MNNVGIKQRNADARGERAKPAPDAFTLIELLVVISIITLLVTILVPSISSVMKLASISRATVRIRELSDGAEQFKLANEYYPGQMTLPRPWEGDFAGKGSNILYTALKNGDYAVFKDDDILDNGAISDRISSNPMPILYYPCLVGVAGLDQYIYDDNSVYSTGWTEAAFSTYITDTRFGTNDEPYMPQRFLLIGANTHDLDKRFYGKQDGEQDFKLTNFNK